MDEIFEWDPEKAGNNLLKHAASFEEAASVFFDSLSVTISDPAHSLDENRNVILGHSLLQRLLVVVHVDRGDKIRIISARVASPQERRKYESH